MNDTYTTDNIISSLTILQHDLEGYGKIMWPQELHNYIKMKEDALKVLKNVSQLQNHLHTGWMGYVQGMFEAEQLDSFFWVNTYRHLASEFDVPMSWIACLKIQPTFDHMGSFWKVHKTDFFDDDGNVPDIVYAAWLDGVSDEVFVDEPFLYARKDKNIAMTDMANDFLNEIVKSMEYDSPEDFLKQFSHEYDMYIPK
jgi:hypothetical protein